MEEFCIWKSQELFSVVTGPVKNSNCLQIYFQMSDPGCGREKKADQGCARERGGMNGKPETHSFARGRERNLRRSALPGITVFCVIRITGYSPQATLIARNQFQAHASWSAACSLSKLDVGTIEFEDALGVAADEDAILFDKNAIGVKTRSVWGV
jgi:hypothetical protein